MPCEKWIEWKQTYAKRARYTKIPKEITQSRTLNRGRQYLVEWADGSAPTWEFQNRLYHTEAFERWYLTNYSQHMQDHSDEDPQSKSGCPTYLNIPWSEK